MKITERESHHPGQRDRILTIAARLFAERGYHAIGMSELGDAVQLGRGALYHHIKSKEDILYNITREYISELEALAEATLRSEADPRKRISALGRQLVLKIASHRAELTVCFQEIRSLTEPRRSEVLSLHKRYENAWRETMAEGARLGVFRPYDSIVLKAMLGMYFYSYLWMRTDGNISPALIAEQLNDLALRMLEPHLPGGVVALPA